MEAMAWRLLLLVGIFMCGGCATGPRVAPTTGPQRLTWESARGGVCGRIAPTTVIDAALLESDSGVRIAVLQSDLPEAYAFPDGTIYVARSLVEAVDHRELRAAVAHEYAHLLMGGHVKGSALTRPAAGPEEDDIERCADHMAVQLLQRQGIHPVSLLSLLQKIAAQHPDRAVRAAMQRRADLLTIPGQPTPRVHTAASH